MLIRKNKAAANSWYKLGRPIITSGDKAGQRDTERIVFNLKVIPEDAFTMFGDRKVTGFTLDEIKAVYNGGPPQYLYGEEVDDILLAKLEMGPGMDQVTKEELGQVIEAVTKTGILNTPSPLDPADRMRLNLEQQMAPKNKGGRPKKNAIVADTSTDGPSGTGSTGGKDSAPDSGSE